MILIVIYKDPLGRKKFLFFLQPRDFATMPKI